MRRLLLSALLLLLLDVAPAPAQHEMSATVSPETVVHGEHTRVTWRITVKTHAQPADLRLELSPWTNAPADAPSFEALRLRADEVRVEGDGTLERGSILVSDPCMAFVRPLPTYGARFEHGFDRGSAGYRLQVPAESEATVVVPVELSADAPWTDVMFMLSLKVGDSYEMLPAARSGGPRGVYLSLKASPAVQHAICGDWVRFTHGQALTIEGTAYAPDGHRVDLVEYGPADREVRPIATLPVQEGRFRLDGWRPGPGEHVLAARYTSQGPGHTDDFSRPVWFAVDPAPPPPPPPPVPNATPRLLGAPRVAGGFARVRVRCPLQARCRGIVRLLRAGRRLAARRYDLAAGTGATLRLRLPSATRRTLRKRRRLAAAIVLAPTGGDAVTHRVTLRRR